MGCSNCLQPDQDIPEHVCIISKSTYELSTKTPIRCWGCAMGTNTNSVVPYKMRYNETLPTSLYMEDKSSIVVYKNPIPLFFNVNWNQSSDRPIPHKQTTNIQRNTSSLVGTRTGLKPGAMAPGGVGVDIKHNSFYRYNLRKRGAVLKTNKCCNI
jgi:hypothetical protein